MDSLYNPPCAYVDLSRYDVKDGYPCMQNPYREDDLLHEFQQITSLLNLIKACGKQKDLPKGSRIHAGVLKRGLLQKNIYVGTALLRMYAKCGTLAKAQDVFDELPERDVPSWNAIIACYAQHGLGDEALNCFGQMRDEGLYPDAVTFLCILKACGSIGAVDKGMEIHAEVGRQGLLEKKIALGTALVDMYAKCGAITNAQEVFDELPAQDVASWTALLSGYVQQGLGDEALTCFARMRDEGLSPDAVTFSYILKACGSIGASETGEEIHSEVCRRGLLEKNCVLGTAVVDMYAKCGMLSRAQEVFDELPTQNVASWTALITGYVQHGLNDEALNCFIRMLDKGLSPNTVTFVCILKACGSMGAYTKGEEIHAEVDRQGLLKESIVLGNALIEMYAKCGVLAKAQTVFDKLPARDIASWNVLMGGYAQHGCGDKIVDCFHRMRVEGLSPNTVTFVCILKACGSLGDIDMGEEIHAEVSRQGLLEKSIALGNALVDMYAKCGVFEKAKESFDMLPARDVASWNALISGYAQHGIGDEALKCFRCMREEGLSPDVVTFLCVLRACGCIGAAEYGKDIHDEIRKKGLLEKHTVLGTALLDMYAKCGTLARAQEVFVELPVKDVVSWTALIAGYTQHGFSHEALNCFGQMQDEGLPPNVVTYICILKACASIGATEKGKEIHDEVKRQRLLENNVVLGRALVDMYAKCGALAQAQQVFDELLVKDVVSWTALIAGYAQLGNVRRVFDLFSRMIGECIEPSAVTFVVLLNACSHAGLVEEGGWYFDTMSTVYKIIPTVEHHSCMVDLFSRAGLCHEAVSVIEKMPSSDCLLLWSAFLSSCRKSINVEFGRVAFEHAIRLDKKYDSAYVCMSNIYAASGMQEEVDKVEALRMKNEAWKVQGCCWWIDASTNLHFCKTGDEHHPESSFINAKIKDIGKKLLLHGCSHLHDLSQAISNDGKKNVLCGHREIFAMAWALINTHEGTPIHVIKNMRVCVDCHLAIMLISKMEKRKIMVKDANCIHIFKGGNCSCESW